MNRRKFIYGVTRGGILGAMALLTGVLLSRKQLSLKPECGLNLQCRSCRILSDCQLPSAEKEREHEKG